MNFTLLLVWKTDKTSEPPVFPDVLAHMWCHCNIWYIHTYIHHKCFHWVVESLRQIFDQSANRQDKSRVTIYIQRDDYVDVYNITILLHVYLSANDIDFRMHGNNLATNTKPKVVSGTTNEDAWQLNPPCQPLALQRDSMALNTLRPRQNGRHFPDAIFKWIFFNENVWISINISQKFVPRGPINNIPALVQIMAWRRPGDKSLSEAMMVRSTTHICVTQPQWVNVKINPHFQWSSLFLCKKV